MKFEWRKKEKNLYLPKNKPELIKIPEFKFLILTGNGDPNGEEFGKKVEALYSLSYAIRMSPKRDYTPDGYFEYTVYPLEGLWDLTEKGKALDSLDKNELIYKIMIRQPDFVTEKVVKNAINHLKNKKKKEKLLLLDEINFDTITEGLSVQMMHIGPYSEEEKAFNMMKDFIKENNLNLRTLEHREIYISDPRRVEEIKLKTVLRYKVSK